MSSYPLDYNGKYDGSTMDCAITEFGIAPNFEVRDASTAYRKYELVTNNGKMYKCLVDGFYGNWLSNAWQETSLTNEMMEIRGTGESGYETLTVNFSVNKGSGSVVGKSVRFDFTPDSSSMSVTKTIGADGKISMLIPIGDKFIIKPSKLDGYMILNSGLITASLSSRTINMKYIQADPGCYIIDDQGIETPVAEWDSSNNNKACWVKYIDQNLYLADQPIIFPKTLQTFSSSFCPEYRDFTTITNRANATQANSDYLGKTESDAWISEATTPNEQQKTYVDIYNETYGKSITIDGYLPAIRGCYNKTVNYRGSVYHGYLPSMGQLRIMCDNLSTLQYAMNLIGGSEMSNLSSGYWWSCSERSNYYCWILSYGNTDFNGKNTSGSVFPLYALS